MVDDRLVWFLEKNKLITTVQSCFRKHRSTMHHLIRFVTFIREAFIKKKHAVSVFFDLESAYDLYDVGVKDRLANFISALFN